MNSDIFTEVTDEMAKRSQPDATLWFAGWLRRRDEASALIAAEQLAECLDVLAVELRCEARRRTTARSRGLLLAATVLIDTATGVRVGELLTASSTPG